MDGKVAGVQRASLDYKDNQALQDVRGHRVWTANRVQWDHKGLQEPLDNR